MWYRVLEYTCTWYEYSKYILLTQYPVSKMRSVCKWIYACVCIMLP